MRLASLLLLASLATGCLTGIDQKPYDVHVLPRIDPDDQLKLIAVAFAVAVVTGLVYVAADQVSSR